MRLTALTIGLLTVCMWAGSGYADIYVWIDADGVRNLSNHNPPPGAEIIMHFRERPRDEKEGEPENEAGGHRRLQEARPPIRSPDDRLAEQQAEMERRIEEAERRAAVALRKAERLEASISHRYDSATRYSTTYVYAPQKFISPHHRHATGAHRHHRDERRNGAHRFGKGHHRFDRHHVKKSRHFDSRFKLHRDRHVKRFKTGGHHLRKRHFVTGPLRTRPYVGSRGRITGHHRRGFRR